MLHKVYITFGLKFKESIFSLFLFIIMSISINTYSQQSLNYFGSLGNSGNRQFRMNSVESNTANFNGTQDWEFSLSINSRINDQNNINLMLISLGKRIDRHYLYARYTPSINQEFVFNSRTEFLIGDTLQNYKTNLSYSEKYAFGYAYEFSDKFSLGFSFRYLQQNFSEEYPTFYSDSTIQVIQIRNEFMNKNYWRGDFGLVYRYSDDLNIKLSTSNLFILKDFDKEDDDSEFGIKKTIYNIKQSKSGIIGFDYFLNNFSLNANFETNSSFTFGMNHGFAIDDSYLTLGSMIFHDEYQQPFIAGILPSINYSNDLFGISISYLKYFSNRTISKSLDDFKKFGVHNIQNNFFSLDKLSITLNFALSFKNTQKVKFLDVDITNSIFPTFVDNYINTPIAAAKVLNLTNEVISLKPSCLISDINSEVVYSPIVSVQPNDTVIIPIFTIVDEDKAEINKTKISNVRFFLTTDRDEPDDEISKPILVNTSNSWDGNVRNLKYFVNNDLNYANIHALQILNSHFTELKNTDEKLITFEHVRILFNSFVKNMNYVSDRRATYDYVQFPRETIQIMGGDCDDLSVGFSALLESVGIQTAFIDYKPNGTIGHVSLLVNTRLSPEESNMITINDKKYFVRKNTNGVAEVWIPIEITSLNNFEEAWNIGSSKFYKEAIDNYGLSKSKVEIIDLY